MKKASVKTPSGARPRATAAGKGSGTKTAARKAPPRRGAGKNIIAAGIKALTNVHEEAITRQSRVFESILGLNPKRDAVAAGDDRTANPLAVALDPFGFRKFEDVFDQRVARALANLGVPSAETVAALTAEVERLRARIAQLETQAKKR